MDLFEFFDKGGPVMWPILFTSVAGLAVFLEKLWEFRGRAVLPDEFLRRIRHYVEAGDIQHAAAEAASNRSSIAVILRAGFQNIHKGRAERKEALVDAGQAEVAQMTRWISVMAVVATVGPLLGLLGTVTGMLKVFMDISQYDNPHISVLARGIYEALITTVAGLPVGILGYLFHAYTEGRLDRLSGAMAEEATWLLDHLPEDATASAPVVRQEEGPVAFP